MGAQSITGFLPLLDLALLELVLFESLSLLQAVRVKKNDNNSVDNNIFLAGNELGMSFPYK